MKRKILAWSVTVTAVVTASIHLIWPTLAIDAITVTLLLVSVLPWLAPLFKAIELPGGVKVEFAELEKAQRDAQSAGILSGPSTSRKTTDFPLLIQTDDPNLALAGLRIELERRLRKIAEQNGIPARQRGVGLLMRDLQARNLLTREQSSILADLMPSLNAAVHGARVDPRASAWASEVGPQLLAGLEMRETIDVESLLSRWREADGADVAVTGEELSKAAIRSPREFLRVMSSAPEDFERWLAKLQYHTFTIYQSRNDLDDELYGAYYEKLRLRLLEAMKTFSNDPTFGALALRLSETVSKIAICTIQ